MLPPEGVLSRREEEIQTKGVKRFVFLNLKETKRPTDFNSCKPSRTNPRLYLNISRSLSRRCMSWRQIHTKKKLKIYEQRGKMALDLQDLPELSKIGSLQNPLIPMLCLQPFLTSAARTWI